VRAGPDEVHVPEQDVPELRQFIEVELSKPSPQWSDAICVVALPFRGCAFFDSHRTELQEAERPTVQPDAFLNEKHGSSMHHVNGQSDEGHQRQSHHQRHGGYGGANEALCRTIHAATDTCVRDQQMQRCSLVEEDLTRQALIRLVARFDGNALDLLTKELA
jgi:hypothetical protein